MDQGCSILPVLNQLSSIRGFHHLERKDFGDGVPSTPRSHFLRPGSRMLTA